MTQILLKRTNVSGLVPTAAQLALGELAINTYDGKVFLKRNNGIESIVTLANSDHNHDNMYLPLIGGTISGNLTITGILNIAQPEAPTNLTFSQNNGNVTLSFNASNTNNIDWYEIWRSNTGITGSYELIHKIPKSDTDPTMTYTDTNITKMGTVYYKIYACKNGVFSGSLNGTYNVTTGAPQIINLQVIPSTGYFIIQFDITNEHKLNYVNIKVDKKANPIDLNENNAVSVYTGKRTTYFYTVNSNDSNLYHKFWVYAIANT